jgi:23S rRNA (cytidine1920-2'-O)/16S rRNA (cytidine1409-2'-O)-methyltransferase
MISRKKPMKKRLDILLCDRGLAPSREKARGMVMAGEVSVDGRLVDKPGSQVDPESQIVIKARTRYVSRGGEKLHHALEAFLPDIRGWVCADVGASTGGFTDCLLQHGVERVYAIDVGYGQIDYRLRQDSRVLLMERTNARYLESLPERVQLVTVDASFISLKLLLPAIKGWLHPNASVIALIKPQFEAGRESVGKGGVVRDTAIHRKVLHDILDFAQQIGLPPQKLISSPIKGPAGNIEFLVWLCLTEEDVTVSPDSLIAQVLP